VRYEFAEDFLDGLLVESVHEGVNEGIEHAVKNRKNLHEEHEEKLSPPQVVHHTALAPRFCQGNYTDWNPANDKSAKHGSDSFSGL